MVYLTLSIEISVYKYDIKPGLLKCRAVEWVARLLFRGTFQAQTHKGIRDLECLTMTSCGLLGVASPGF